MDSVSKSQAGVDEVPIQIKRYANRKMYDLSARQYITLEGVARLVKEGQEVRVVDNETGQDVTALVFSQIIVEQAKAQPESLPEGLLASLIRAREDAAGLAKRMAWSPMQLLAGAGEMGSAWHLVNVPTREDVLRLIEQVEALSVRLGAIMGEDGSPE